MQTRPFVAFPTLAVAALLVAACGDDTASDGSGGDAATTASATTTSPSSASTTGAETSNGAGGDGGDASGAGGAGSTGGGGPGCLEDDPPPDDLCQGVCTLVLPTCVEGEWACTGPAFEPVEESCDGFDNDCDGEVDEDVCEPCTVPLATIEGELDSRWDIDFDNGCRSYLTSLVSGPDDIRVIDADGTVDTFLGNANQNMGFALVDPDQRSQRVVATYSCRAEDNCLGTNGLTLLYTCDDDSDPDCGCAGQTNCPGLLDEPFLAADGVSTSLTFQGVPVATPTGLAAGVGNAYFVGNFKPLDCDASQDCVPCGPDDPGVFCTPTLLSCCDTTPLGRLARFTLPDEGVEPTWRIEQVFDGEEILGLASGRDGSVFIGTKNAEGGTLYRYDPVQGTAAVMLEADGTVFSITQVRSSGDLYLEVRADPKILRLSEAGEPLALPDTVPANPDEEGVLQVGPDGKLYRLRGEVDDIATLEVYDLE